VLDGCAAQLRGASRSADTLASKIGVLIGGSATGVDREMAVELRQLAAHLWKAARALEFARTR
jgi:hypothetical protein